MPAVETADSTHEQLCEENGEKEESLEGRAAYIIKVSLGVAFAWWGFGFYTVISTRSLAVLASLVDATIDLAAQGVLLGANRLAESNMAGELYPVGVSRLEPVGVVVCAVLMVLASGAVIYDSIATLACYFPAGPEMVFTDAASVMLAVVVAVKIVVWRAAKFEYERTNNVSLEALALDNFNDILSNASALVFASLTRLQQTTWFLDPIGGVLISIYIIRSWCLTALEQVNVLVGKQADPELVSAITEIAENHDPSAELDLIRAYHFGPKVMVEVDLVMDGQMPLEVTHDVAISLQDRIERMEECERCFVHIDYKHRDHDLHDTSIPLEVKTMVRRSSVSTSAGLRLRTVLSLRKGSSASINDQPSISSWRGAPRRRCNSASCILDRRSSNRWNSPETVTRRSLQLPDVPSRGAFGSPENDDTTPAPPWMPLASGHAKAGIPGDDGFGSLVPTGFHPL